jgi:hypothetical protein
MNQFMRNTNVVRLIESSVSVTRLGERTLQVAAYGQATIARLLFSGEMSHG